MDGRLRAVVAAIVLFAAAPACKRGRVEDAPETRRIVDAGELLAHPDEYSLKMVSTAGEVEDVYSTRVFTIGGRDFFDRELLIASRVPVSPNLREDDIVLATGKIQRLTIVELERNWKVDLKADVELEFSTEPMLVATSVVVTHRAPKEKPEQLAEVRRHDTPIHDVIQLFAATSTALEGRRIHLDQVRVREVLEGHGFWVGPSWGRRVFVVPAEGQALPEDGSTISIDGTVRRIPERDLDEEVAQQLEGESVWVIAEELTEAQAGRL